MMNFLNSFTIATTNTPRKKSNTELKNWNNVTYHHITNKRSKSYKLKIDPKKGLVLVTPPLFSQKKIDEFISQNQSWIEYQHQKINQKKQAFDSDTDVRIFGRTYKKKIRTSNVEPSSVVLQKTKKEEEEIARSREEQQTQFVDSLLITVQNDSPQTIRQTLNRFLKQTAEQYIIPRTQQLALKMNTNYTSITFGEHKSQWGSCHVSGKLTFNWRLVHAPIEIIDSVIIHELAHRTHHNHSAKFWALVAKYNPNYKQHSTWLKRHGVSVG